MNPSRKGARSAAALWQYTRRHAALSRDLLTAAARSPTLPLKLTLALTFRCHHRCAICGIWARPKGAQMSAVAIDRLLASVPALTWLDLTGGEITARKDLEAIVASVHRRLPRLLLLHFPTGGWHPERAESAARAMVVPGGPRVVVTVSVDGPPALHDRLRGVDGAWQRAMETLARLRQIREVDAYPGLTLQPGNLHAVDDTLAALQGRFPDLRHADLHVNLMHRSPHYFANSSAEMAERSAMVSALETFTRKKGRPSDPIQWIERAFLELLPEHVATGRSPIPCRSGELSAYVAPDGTTYACTIDPRPAGRLADWDFDLPSLWQAEARRRLRAEIASGRCIGCWTPCEAYQTLLTSPVRVVQRVVQRVAQRATQKGGAAR